MFHAMPMTCNVLLPKPPTMSVDPLVATSQAITPKPNMVLSRGTTQCSDARQRSWRVDGTGRVVSARNPRFEGRRALCCGGIAVSACSQAPMKNEETHHELSGVHTRALRPSVGRARAGVGAVLALALASRARLKTQYKIKTRAENANA